MITHYAVGHQAEQKAADYLKAHGFKVLDINWKTRYCEIDLIAVKQKTVHFVEVKYRANSTQGRGLDYVTPSKLRQMRFAAEMWVQEQLWKGDYTISAIELSGPEYSVTQFLENCE